MSVFIYLDKGWELKQEQGLVQDLDPVQGSVLEQEQGSVQELFLDLLKVENYSNP